MGIMFVRGLVLALLIDMKSEWSVFFDDDDDVGVVVGGAAIVTLDIDIHYGFVTNQMMTWNSYIEEAG